MDELKEKTDLKRSVSWKFDSKFVMEIRLQNSYGKSYQLSDKILI